MATYHCGNCGRPASVTPAQTTVNRDPGGLYWMGWTCPKCKHTTHLGVSPERATEMVAEGAVDNARPIGDDEADYLATVLADGHTDQVWELLGGKPTAAEIRDALGGSDG